jgi:hypothetical protein
MAAPGRMGYRLAKRQLTKQLRDHKARLDDQLAELVDEVHELRAEMGKVEILRELDDDERHVLH